MWFGLIVPWWFFVVLGLVYLVDFGLLDCWLMVNMVCILGGYVVCVSCGLCLV